MNPRVLFFFPNTSNDGVLPLAVGILSTIAKNQQCDVRYFESTFYNKTSTATEERESTGEFKPVEGRNKNEYPPLSQLYSDLQDILTSYQPQVLAVHANSLEWELFKEVMARIVMPDHAPLVFVGGVHATIDPESVMQMDFVDVACVGEGEGAWGDFLRAEKDGNDISYIENLWVRTQNGVRRNPMRPLIPSDRLWNTSVDYSLFDKRHMLKPYDGEMRHRALIEYSRGCPYDCHYCVNSALKEKFQGLGRYFRVRPFESFQQEVRRLVDLGAEIFQLQDECFFSNNVADIQRFCEWYRSEINLPLLLQTRPESVTDEKMCLVAKMGLPVQVSLGVESGSTRILRKICNRQMSIESIKKAFKVIHKYGLRSNAYCMIGFPTETREEAFQTINLIREITPTIAIMSVFYPFQGVPLRQFCVDQGFINGSESARTFTDDTILRDQPMNPDEIKNIRRCFSLYTKLPERFLPSVERCELEFEQNRELFAELVERLWASEPITKEGM